MPDFMGMDTQDKDTGLKWQASIKHDTRQFPVKFLVTFHYLFAEIMKDYLYRERRAFNLPAKEW